MTSPVNREEFDHLINDFEVFKDSVMDELSRLRQDIEIVKEELSELTRDLSGKLSGNRDQKRLV